MLTTFIKSEARPVEMATERLPSLSGDIHRDGGRARLRLFTRN
jgi:hypothetical protein